MADATIETRFLLQDRISSGITRVSDTINGLAGSFKKAETQATDLGSVVSGISQKLAMVGAAVGGAAILGNVIKLNEEFENTSIRIAGTLKAFKLAPTIEVAQEKATRAMSVIQDMAASLPGETDEYINVFATALPQAIAAGMTDITQIATFTSKWMALASSNTIDSMQAGMDLYRMLAGQAGADVRMWTVLQKQVGMTADEFNKLAKARPDQVVAKITEVLSAYDDQQRIAADSFSAKMGEFQATLKEIQRLAGKELFEKSKSTLDEINKFLRENKDQIVEIGKQFLSNVIPALKLALPVLKTLAEHGKELAIAATAFATLWVTSSIVSSISNITKAVLVLRDGIIAAKAESSGLFKMGGGTLGSTTVAGPGATNKGVGLGLLVSGMAVIGSMLMSTLDDAEASRKAAAAASKQNWEITRHRKSGQEALKYFGDLRRLAEAGRPKDAAPLSTVELMEFAAKRERSMKTSGDVTDRMIRAVVEYEKALGSPQSAVDLEAYRTFFKGGDLTAPAPPKAPKGRTEQHFDFRNSRFDIKQNFAEGFDPDRIAVAFAQDLGRAGELRTQSGFQQAYVAR